MKMRFEIRKEADHTVVEAAGTYDDAGAREAIETAISTALAAGHRKLLVDARQVTGKPRTMQRFDLGQALARYYHEQRGGKVLRIAIIGHEPLIDPERFGEVVANNRGLPLRSTTDLGEALRFLEIEPPEQ